MIVSTSPQAPDRVLTEVASTSTADVAAAAERARAVQRDWAHGGPAARAAALNAAADAVEQAADELTALVVAEVGKPRTEARGEVARAVSILRYYAQQAFDPLGATHDAPGDTPHLHHPPSARCRRADHAVELPARDPGLEGCARAGVRQRGIAQARRGGHGLRRTARRAGRPVAAWSGCSRCFPALPTPGRHCSPAPTWSRSPAPPRSAGRSWRRRPGGAWRSRPRWAVRTRPSCCRTPTRRSPRPPSQAQWRDMPGRSAPRPSGSSWWVTPARSPTRWLRQSKSCRSATRPTTPPSSVR